MVHYTFCFVYILLGGDKGDKVMEHIHTNSAEDKNEERELSFHSSLPIFFLKIYCLHNTDAYQIHISFNKFQSLTTSERKYVGRKS